MRVQDVVILKTRLNETEKCALRSSIVDVNGSDRWCSHRAMPRNHGCCHWRPRPALSPSNHVQSTILKFPLRVPILNLLSSCINSSQRFPVAILCTLLHRENVI